MTTPARGEDRPLLGLRRRPGRLTPALFRMPLHAYRHDAGALLGHTVLQLTQTRPYVAFRPAASPRS